MTRKLISYIVAWHCNNQQWPPQSVFHCPVQFWVIYIHVLCSPANFPHALCPNPYKHITHLRLFPDIRVAVNGIGRNSYYRSFWYEVAIKSPWFCQSTSKDSNGWIKAKGLLDTVLQVCQVSQILTEETKSKIKRN